MKKLSLVFLGWFGFTSSLWAADIPGGSVSTAELFPERTSTVQLTPTYRFSSQGAYLATRFRHQIASRVALGATLGAGEGGFHAGGEATWFALPAGQYEPALAILGGLYIDRSRPYNYFVTRIMPTVSQTFITSFGQVTPYASVHLLPSVGFGSASSVFSLKASLGSEVYFLSAEKLRVWFEFAPGIVQAPHELIIGISYPI